MKITGIVSGIALLVAALILAVQGFRVREGFQDAVTQIAADADQSIAKTFADTRTKIADTDQSIAKRLNSTLAQIVADRLGTTLERGSDQQFGLENAVAPALAASPDVATSVGVARDAFTTTPSMETFDTQSNALRAADPKTWDSTQNTLQQQDITNGLIRPGRLNCPIVKSRLCPEPNCPRCSCKACEPCVCPKCPDTKAEVRKAAKEVAKKRVVELTTRLKKAKTNQDAAKKTQDALKNKTAPEAKALLTSLNQQRDTQIEQQNEQTAVNTEATAQGFQDFSPSRSSLDRFFNGGRASAETTME